MAPLRDILNLFARRFALALQTSTRVRTTGALAPPAPPAGELVQASTAHIPGVGWLVGIAACLAFALVSVLLRDNAWDPMVAAVACTMATAALTGALHESALYRFADHVGAGAGDAHRSGHGALALVLLLAAKLGLLASLATTSEAALMAALFAGHVVSRFLLVVACWAASAEADARSLRVGALWCIVPLLLMVPAGGVAFLAVPIVASGLACFAVLRFCRNEAAESTAERPGVVQQVCEAAFYLGAAIAI